MSAKSFKIPKKDFFISYYEDSGRCFPWRRDDLTPFQSLITEMLLRQTQATSVSNIWKYFVTRYSDPQKILNSDESEIITLIENLGLYNQRVGALKSVSNWLLENFDGNVPSDLKILLEGPHIGEYTAKAVRCFAFNKREEIVDVNILRFLGRYFGRELNSLDVRRNSWSWEIAKSILPKNEVKKHNYGLLDFSSAICTARNPNCQNCPLFNYCEYLNE